MSSEIILQQTPEQVALLEKREQLASVRNRLAETEAEVAQVRAQLAAFEGRYMRQVGVLYAELDALEARIVEKQAELEDSDAARLRVEEARRRAQESYDAAYGEAREEEEAEPAPNLKALFRELAKRIHPDFARDDAEGKYFTMLMARANQAYRRGDAETLQRLLDDHREIHAAVAGESTAAEMLRMARQIQQAERDLSALEMERYVLQSGEIGQLHADAESAAMVHRDLLSELEATVRIQIADAQRRCDLLESASYVHGR